MKVQEEKSICGLLGGVGAGGGRGEGGQGWGGMSVVACSPWAAIPPTKLKGPGLEGVGIEICSRLAVFCKSPIGKNRYGDRVPV